MGIAIIGAGLTGLTAAYRLSQKGHKVTLFEKERQAGGLASGFKEKGWNWHLERFFHHLFASDQAAKNLIRELGLFDKLFYVRAKTSIFKRSKISQFDSPITLLTFPHLSFPEKLRAGLITAYLKLKTPRMVAGWSEAKAMTPEKGRGPLGTLCPPRWKDWKFEKVTASAWLKKHYGQRVYQILWQPLLQGKFANFANQIPMSWFWARIKKRSPRLGYLEGGFQVLINKLIEKIKAGGGKVLLNHEVKSLNELKSFDRIIVTTPVSVFLKIASSLTSEVKPGSSLENTSEVSMKRLKMLGALNLILVLKEKFLADGTYWLNINEADFPFVAVVEHTNFVNPKHYGGNHLIYVGGYYPQSHRYFKMNKNEIFEEFLPYLQKINPKFNQISNSSLREIPSEYEYRISKSLHAQPIIPINYSKMIPKMRTLLPNVYLANMQMVYPWDRGINYAIELGEGVANEILKDI